MRSYLFPVLALACYGVAFADSIETWDDLKNIITSHGITNIDDLLAHLPDEYTKGFSLVYRTRALGQERVSPRRPRVLLFGQDAKFVLAYNSHESGGQAKPGDIESIETLAFDEPTGTSTLREVVFDGRSVPDFSKIEDNPARCSACHAQSAAGVGADPAHSVHGLWDPYNSWSDLPSQDYSTAITRGDNVDIDANYALTGSTNVFYGNISRCYTPEGKLKSRVTPYDIKNYCNSEAVDEFVTDYLPPRFFMDDNGQPFDVALEALSCDELAAKSRAALADYFAN